MFSRYTAPVVALSGGVDSSLLTVLCHEYYGDSFLAVTAVSPAFPDWDRDAVTELVKRFSIKHIFIETGEFQDSRYLQNEEDRCYWCRYHLFASLRGMLLSNPRFDCVFFGAQRDDLADDRPGHRAASEFGVIAPFIEAEWSRKDIIAEARARDFSWADTPPSPCLASRLVTGIRVSPERLKRIKEAEIYLRARGYQVVRVRDRGDAARVEVGREDLHRLNNNERAEIISRLQSLGFSNVEFSPEGYRRGGAARLFPASILK